VFNYVYPYKDHLGNVRLSYKNTSNTGVNQQIVEENNYYPFGLEHKGYGPERTSNHPYKFGGKEFNEELGLDWYDVSARNYDPALGRWMNIDMKSEAYYPVSPYQYVLNNPIVNTDHNGQWTVTRHYNMTYNALAAAGIGKEQADLLAHYSSVYADHPGPHKTAIGYVDAGFLNDLVHMWFNPYDRLANYRRGIDYSATRFSQETEWYSPELRQNFNIWHSMRSPSEAKNNSISEHDAMMRGMQFGWSKVFESAEHGNLNSLVVNSEGAEAWGQGSHALQDAFAHKGTDTDNHSVRNDIRGDTGEARGITDSAILVHNLLSKNYSAIEKTDKISINTMGMDATQVRKVITAAWDYLSQD
jgi:RHS repeat-associated protein